MSETDCSSEMLKYHKDKVTLQKSQQDEMRSRRNNGRTRLNNGMEENNHPKPVLIHSQGSYAMRTMVQDPQNDYDIDDGAYFNKADLVDDNGKELTPHEARERVCKALQRDQRLKTPAEIHNNCVRQEYPEGYHIDIPVYRIVKVKDENDNDAEEYQLASGDEWVKSDARAVTRWYNGLVGELNTGESDGSQMRRVTKLTKHLARSRLDWKPETCSGITITKLVAEHFVCKSNRDDESVKETWEAIKSYLEKSQKVEHPVNDSMLANDGDEKACFFRDCLRDALDELAILEKSDCTKKQALGAWDAAFATSFFIDQYKETSQTENKASVAAPAFSVTSNEPARRDDGGRRFG